MNGIIQKLGVLAIAMAATLTAAAAETTTARSKAYDFEVNGIYYNIIDPTAKEVEVTYESESLSPAGSYSGKIEVPSSVSYNGERYTVKSIGEGALANCINLTSITLPTTVTSINDFAFNYCTGLTSVTMPNTVTSIGHGAFEDCISLTTITLPKMVTSLGDDVFAGCTGLMSINVDSDNPSYSSIDGFLCDKSKTTLIICPTGKTGDITLPDFLKSIGHYSFRGCAGLTSITLPKSLASIGVEAFSGCSGLTSITLSDTVASIGEYAFVGCTGLTSITLPGSLTSIADGLFSDCTGLVSITLPDSLTSIGVAAFSNCPGLMSITSSAVTPPDCSDSSFDFADGQNCYVPAKSIAAYKQAEGWRNFSTFSAIK